MVDGKPYYFCDFEDGCPKDCGEDVLIDVLEAGMQFFSVEYMVNLTTMSLEDWKENLKRLTNIWCDYDDRLKSALEDCSDRDRLYEKVYEKGQRSTVASVLY